MHLHVDAEPATQVVMHSCHLAAAVMLLLLLLAWT
jgi:hypothetical protein